MTIGFEDSATTALILVSKMQCATVYHIVVAQRGYIPVMVNVSGERVPCKFLDCDPYRLALGVFQEFQLIPNACLRLSGISVDYKMSVMSDFRSGTLPPRRRVFRNSSWSVRLVEACPGNSN